MSWLSTHRTSTETYLVSQFFDWSFYDSLDSWTTTYHAIVTKVQVGDFPAGTKFTHACLDVKSGTLSLHDGDVVATFAVALQIAAQK